MSSFITTDYTVLAIVEGMRRYGFMEKNKRDFRDMAEALRGINEEMTWRQWTSNGKEETLFEFDEFEHEPVDIDLTRDFTDGEIWMSCKCWLYQVDTGDPMDFDFITLMCAVRMLRDTIIEQNLEAGTWKKRCYFGNYHYFQQDPEDETWGDIEDEVEWDLAA